MAVNEDVLEKTLEDLEKEITCAVCQEHYTDPRKLPCLHCYCKQCILQLAIWVGNSMQFRCPICWEISAFPKGGEDELKSAFIINRLKSMCLKHKKALSKKVNCEICTNTEALAEAFCRQCDKFACKNCVHQHTPIKRLFERHEWVTIEQVQKILSEELINKFSEPKQCSTHGKLLKIFCFDCHKLICQDCTVNDHKNHNVELNNLAYTVTANANLTQLSLPDEIWHNVNDPYCIRVNSHLEIVVMETDNRLVVFNKKGNVIRTINMKSLLVHKLRSIAVDCDDNIYYVGYMSNLLGKCDCYFKNITVQDVQPERCGHIDIAAVENEVLVTECYNKGQITVYDKDLNFARRISTGKKATLRHLCPDNDGNLYVSDDNTIDIINRSGCILRSFNRDQKGVEILKDPWNVNISGDYVYVTDAKSQKTVVFTTEGQYITSFGCYGPLCVDKDGVIYHCDYLKNRICIYYTSN